MTNIAVFCSGKGTNLQAIIDAIKRKKLSANIAFVLSDKKDAFALMRAKRNNISAIFIDPCKFKSKKLYEAQILTQLKNHNVELIVLAGFMRVLSAGFVKEYKNRIMNIHPALLPSFPGKDAVKDAISYGVKLTGVTIHFVDEGVDSGPVILQSAVEVLQGDTEKTLLEHIHNEEHRLYPKAIQLFIDGRLAVKGGKVILRGVSSGRLTGHLP